MARTVGGESFSDSITGGDWELHTTISPSLSVPGPAGFYMLDVSTDSTSDADGTHIRVAEHGFSAAATDWINPYVVYFDLQAHENYVHGGWGAAGLDCEVDIGKCSTYGVVATVVGEAVNQEVSSTSSGGAPFHELNPFPDIYTQVANIYGEAAGEDPSVNSSFTDWSSGISFSLAANTSSTAATYVQVPVTPMGVAYIGTSSPVFNLETGAAATGYYVDAAAGPAYIVSDVGYSTGNYPTGGALTTTPYDDVETGTSPAINGRYVLWYGDYASDFNAAGFGTIRNSADAYTNNTTGDIIGQFVEYQVVQAHPLFDMTGITPGTEISYLPSYAFQAAMKLGPIIGIRPIYSGYTSPYPLPNPTGPSGPGPGGPGPFGPPVGPGGPGGGSGGGSGSGGGPIGFGPGCSGPVPGIGGTDPGLTGDLKAEVTALDGTLNLTETNGLTAMSGLGTGDLSIQGSLHNVTNALASLQFTAFTNFTGNSIIRVTFDDLGHNGGGTPLQNTIVVPIAVYPSLTLGQFDVATNFQFNIGGGNGVWMVAATTDFTTWTTIGSLLLTNNTGTFVDTNAIGFSQRFYRATQDSTCSDAIGYYHLTIPGRATNGTGGWSAIANQLINTNGNDLNTVIPTAPDGSLLYKWDVAINGYATAEYTEGFGWFPDESFSPGDGGLFLNELTNTAITLAFIGVVPTGPQSLTVSSNGGFYSSIFPSSGGLDAMGFPTHDDDNILLWDISVQDYSNTYTYADGYGWFNPSFPDSTNAPVPGIGQGFYVYPNASAANRVWTENYAITP